MFSQGGRRMLGSVGRIGGRRELVLSGIQPTGVPHLGNYLGAIQSWVRLQESWPGQVLFSVVDLHAMTVEYEANELRRNCMEMTASLLACGIDPEKSVLFRQSAVREHTELAWILGCLTPLGWLQRMTQFKEKAAAVEEKLKKGQKLATREVSRALGNAGLGLLSYPVLQAADILLYRATHVPVGDDQRQHLELARDIAQTFNSRFGDTFPLPKVLVPEGKVARVMSLRDGRRKMSKSDKTKGATISLLDDADTISSRIRKAKTDSLPGITYDPDLRPERANLLAMFASFDPLHRAPQAIADEYAEVSTETFKKDLADVIITHIVPIGDEIRSLLAQQDDADASGRAEEGPIASALQKGTIEARKRAQDSMSRVREYVGVE